MRDEEARSTLKKAVFTCLEIDDSFMLPKFTGLVFEFNFNSDTKFWDELIGKLKRKGNPHAKCLKYKCETNPALVLSNYQRTTLDIVQHFDATNPILTLPWHTLRYLVELSQRPKLNSGMTASVPMLGQVVVNNDMNYAVINQQPKLNSITNESKAQENLDPAEQQRNVLYFKDTDGEHKFKIKIPKREAKFNPKLLII